MSGADSQHRKLLMHLYCPDPYMICLRCKYCGSFETQVEMGWTETTTKWIPYKQTLLLYNLNSFPELLAPFRPVTHTCSSEMERVPHRGVMGACAGTARLGWPCNSICRLPSFCSQSIWRKQTALLLTLPDPVVVIGRQPPIVSQLS